MKIQRLMPALVGIGAIGAGAAIMFIMLGMKQGPAEAIVSDTEQPIYVGVFEAAPEDVPVTISGFGETRALKEVPLSAEVSGRVTYISPNLVAGGLVYAGERLFELESAPFAARVNDARARVAQHESNVGALTLEWENEKTRLTALTRATELVATKLERAKQTKMEGIGSQADVDLAERELVESRNQKDLTARSVEVYPLRIAEAESALEAAQEQLKLAEMELAHCTVSAPFDGRVKFAAVERDQFVVVGEDVIILADDSVLEISVPLDSRDARRWLQFDEDRVRPGSSWFAAPTPVECTVRWTEDDESTAWKGTLHRVEGFEPATRTLTVAVRVAADQPECNERALPLVEGMFCEIQIPCRNLEGVFRVPAGAMTFDNTVYVVVDGKLKTAPVEIARVDAGFAYVQGGLSEGDLVIATRLVNPLENRRCETTVIELDAGMN